MNICLRNITSKFYSTVQRRQLRNDEKIRITFLEKIGMTFIEHSSSFKENRKQSTDHQIIQKKFGKVEYSTKCPLKKRKNSKE